MMLLLPGRIVLLEAWYLCCRLVANGKNRLNPSRPCWTALPRLRSVVLVDVDAAPKVWMGKRTVSEANSDDRSSEISLSSFSSTSFAHLRERNNCPNSLIVQWQTRLTSAVRCVIWPPSREHRKWLLDHISQHGKCIFYAVLQTCYLCSKQNIEVNQEEAFYISTFFYDSNALPASSLTSLKLLALCCTFLFSSSLKGNEMVLTKPLLPITAGMLKHVPRSSCQWLTGLMTF